MSARRHAILIVTPKPRGVVTGNDHTSRDWVACLSSLGHSCTVSDTFDGDDADVLIALHAAASHEAIVAFRRAYPNRPIVVALAGTDIYPEPKPQTLASLQIADRIVGLQSGVRARIPAAHVDKLSIIVQSVAFDDPPPRTAAGDAFDVCVVGNLRAIKDPLRAAEAARLLPASSRIRIRHAGSILEDEYGATVERETATNARYEWLGEVAPADAVALIARSRVLVLSSHHEGGGRVIGEAVVLGTPVLASRNDASVSLLGVDYPGLFDVGATDQLAVLLDRVEREPAFTASLQRWIDERASLFDPARERAAWHDLLAALVPRSTA